MGILSELRNFACEVLGIDMGIPKPRKSEDISKEAVIQCQNVEQPGDKLEINQQETRPNGIVQNLMALKDTIELKCTKYGFDGTDLLKNGLLGKITGLSDEMLNQLSDGDKQKLLGCIDLILSKFQNYRNNGEISEDANINELITENVKVYYGALKSGVFEDLQEYEEAKGDVNAELGAEFKTMDRVSQRAVLTGVRQKDEATLKQELLEVQSLPEEERTEAEQKIRTRHQHIQRGRFMDIVNVNSSETALESLIMLCSNDLEYGTAAILSTRCSAEERSRTADLADYTFFKALAENYDSVGDTLSQEVIERYTALIMSAKSSEAAALYQEEVKQDFKNYEEKIKRGEEVPKHLKALYEGSKKGIEQISTELKREIHQELKTEKSVIIQNSKRQEALEEFSETVILPGNNYAVNENPSSAEREGEDVKRLLENNYVEKTNLTRGAPTKSKTVTSPIAIARVIKQEGLQEAIKQYDTGNIIETILEDGNLRHLRTRLVTIIKSADVNSLRKITDTCSDSAFIFICSIVNPDDVETLRESRGHLCYTARKEIEAIESKDYASI